MTDIHIPSIIFSQDVDFTVNGELALHLRDVLDGDLILRYTTHSSAGMLSVYAHRGIADVIVADSDRTILCDEHGNPTQVTGIQRYFPPSVLCPAYLEVGERWWKRTEGLWAWSSGDNYPTEPWPDATYAHENSFFFETIDGELYLHHDERFHNLGALVFDRGYLYSVADRTLLQFTDNLTHAVYERSE